MSYRWQINDTTENRVVPAFGSPPGAVTQKVNHYTLQQQKDARTRNLYRSGKRRQVSKKTNNACFYCGDKSWLWTYEHLIPKSHGGGNKVSNLVRACNKCNSKRGNSFEIVRFMTDLTFIKMAQDAEVAIRERINRGA